VTLGFFDESLGSAYKPLNYDGHVSNGVFFVAHEGTATVYGYVLFPSGKYHLVASFASGQKSVASLYFDVSTGYLYSECDDSSDGAIDVHEINSRSGKFEIVATYSRPSSLPNWNVEGFCVSPESECDPATQQKFVYWSDDGNDDGHAIYRDTIPCGRYIR
jgi:hypothetical protein